MLGEIIGALAGGLLGGDSRGGSSTASKEPWGPAQQWLKDNIGTGQNLQRYYQGNPFGALQQGAYSNLLGQGDYINQILPGLLAQFSQPTGFNRNSPGTRPQPFQFAAPPPQQRMQGLLGASPSQGPVPAMNSGPANPYLAPGFAPAPAPVAQAPAPKPVDPYEMNINGIWA